MYLKVKLGEVRNIEDDPTQSGRCQVRIYNEQNNEGLCKDDDLAWATPLHPITSAATAKIGVVPHGLLVGSRVLLAFLPEDVGELYPIILGSLGRGDKPPVTGLQKEQDPETGGEINEAGYDNPAVTYNMS